jgi:signal transduction histidine kinase
MELKRSSTLIYGLLLGIWLLLAGWQAEEHHRFRETARTALVNQAKDISTTLGIVLRSQRRFGGLVSKERLEDSLGELVNQEPNELNAIALLNAAGEVVASAGAGIDSSDFLTLASAGETESWGPQTVTLFNPVDLGTNLTRDIEGTNLPIILSHQEFTNHFGPPPSRPPPPTNDAAADSSTNTAAGNTEPPPPPPPDSTNHSRQPDAGRPRFGRPRWMSPEEYQTMLQEKGVHSFAIVMSTEPLHSAVENDFWLRSIIDLFAAISAVGLGLAWRNVAKTSELQIRLVRASELNSHLREMNLAAAGLAHETRNPLNIIRGMAQMISKSDATGDLREKSRAIVDETDKVTAQLNEFINYSRPREVRRAKVGLNAVVTEVVRALNYDIDEKKIRVETLAESFFVEADEQLLRQALFNLLLNAIQAVGENGQIQFVARRENASDAILEIRDDGPGVPPEQRQEIFKPYFTTHQKGTGLGLAVVQQIVLAHGWEIQCLGNEPKGAVFRISHLKIMA